MFVTGRVEFNGLLVRNWDPQFFHLVNFRVAIVLEPFTQSLLLIVYLKPIKI